MSVGSMRYYSESQQRQTILNFVLPNDIPEILTEGNPHYNRPTKNLYLLHGYSGDEYDWLLQGDIVNLSINYNLAIFTFSGGNNFYLDREATGRNIAVLSG
jgi:putative tributyrin esterase